MRLTVASLSSSLVLTVVGWVFRDWGRVPCASWWCAVVDADAATTVGSYLGSFCNVLLVLVYGCAFVMGTEGTLWHAGRMGRARRSRGGT